MQRLPRLTRIERHFFGLTFERDFLKGIDAAITQPGIQWDSSWYCMFIIHPFMDMALYKFLYYYYYYYYYYWVIESVVQRVNTLFINICDYNIITI